jgi:hypothetical protein
MKVLFGTIIGMYMEGILSSISLLLFISIYQTIWDLCRIHQYFIYNLRKFNLKYNIKFFIVNY